MPKAPHILGELAKHQITAVEAEVVAIPWTPSQHMSVLLTCIDERTLGQQAVFIAIAEQKLAEGQQVGVVLIGRGAGDARTIPVESRLRDAVMESEGLEPAHVRIGQNLDFG